MANRSDTINVIGKHDRSGVSPFRKGDIVDHRFVKGQ